MASWRETEIDPWIKEQVADERAVRLYLGADAELRAWLGKPKPMVCVGASETVLLLPSWLIGTALLCTNSDWYAVERKADVARFWIGGADRFLVRVFRDIERGEVRMSLPEGPVAAHCIVYYELTPEGREKAIPAPQS